MAKAQQVEGGKSAKSNEKNAKGGPKTEVTVLPTFLDANGKILMVTTTKQNDKGDVKSKTAPKRLKPSEFPKSADGRKAFCRYQVAMWTWRGENIGARGSDPIAKKERQVKKAMDRLAALQKEVADAKKAAGVA